MSQFPKTKDPAESVIVDFDFSSELDAIDSATVSISIMGDGVDPDVASMLDGTHQISGTHVCQRVHLGVDLVSYKTRCVASKTGGNTIARAKVLAVRTA